MAITVLTDAMVIVNSVTLSDHANKVTVEDMRDEVDVTAFGASSKAIAKGLGDATITVDFFQDFAAGKTYATLQPLIASTTGVTVEVRPTSGGRSATNPAFVMTALMVTFNAIDGQVGAASMITATFRNAAQAGLTYLTA
jgi:hypothetical protein